MDREISFLCSAYRAGVRITHDGSGFIYQAADWLRVMHTKTFGLFPPLEPVEPPADLVSDVTALATTLRPLLRQSVPSALAGWWYHPLVGQYEGVPLLRMAAKRNVSVWLVPCSLGVWPVVVSVPLDERVSDSMPVLSPILQRCGYGFNAEAYRILGEKCQKKKRSQ